MIPRAMFHGPCAAAAPLAVVVLLGLPSCCAVKHDEPQPAPSTVETMSPSTANSGSRRVFVEPGIAGGVVEDSVTVTVTIAEVDTASRKVTLVDDAGHRATLTAGPDIRNLDQIRPGDRLTATLDERLVVYVRAAGMQTDDSYSRAIARVPKGNMPGGIVSENYEVVATVAAIDRVARTATLRFSDGSQRTVPVRSDVDLSRYQLGDNVVIRVTSSLSLLTSRP